MMKKIAFAAALVAGFAGVAHAQSSVTVYGRLNTSVERQKNLSATATANTNQTVLQNNASRIGFKGTEDLGGGLKANFLLEHGFNADNGTTGAAFWGRESWVGLSGNFGAVRLGNMGPGASYFATADYISLHNHDTGTSSDAFYPYTAGTLTNAIAYTSPNFGGLTVEGQVGLKEAGPDNTYVLAANWVGGPLHLGAGYVKAGEANEVIVRALYELGAITLGAYALHDDTGAAGSSSTNKFRVSAMYTLGASEFHANVGAANDRGSNNDGAKQFTLGYNYNLSKRTKLFAFYTKVDNDNGGTYALPTNAAGALATGYAAGMDASSLAVGVRHNF